MKKQKTKTKIKKQKQKPTRTTFKTQDVREWEGPECHD